MENGEVDYLCSQCGWHGDEDEAVQEDMAEHWFCPECGADLEDE